MTRPDPAIDTATGEVRAELRCAKGCNRRWATDFGWGRLCSECDRIRFETGQAVKRQRGLPEFRTPPQHPHQEPRDDLDVPF